MLRQRCVGDEKSFSEAYPAMLKQLRMDRAPAEIQDTPGDLGAIMDADQEPHTLV